MAGDLSDDEKRTLLESFGAVTGLTDQDRARFYLESANWNINLAAEGYFGGDVDAGLDVDLAPASSRITPSPDPEVDPPPQSTGGGRGGQSSKPSGGSSRIATIGSLAHDSHSDDSDDETGETYYAGGSERSGQQVIGPPRKGAKSSGKLIDGVFKAAKERGAETVESLPGAQSSSTGGRSAFQGTAYRLGDTSGPSERIDSRSAAASASHEQVDITLYMWRNGFSVDDGPLREFQSPESQQFIESIKNGEVPRELISAARGAEVSLNMVDRRTEDFVAPKKTVKSFTGEGYRLGSPTDLVTVPAAAPPVSSENAASQQKAAEASVSVDTSAPVTSIQIRLQDGSRLIGKFNQSHTVSDVRRYITTASPEYGGVEFTLMTTFPNKDLTDESQSLSDAGLLNAVLVVKPAKK